MSESVSIDGMTDLLGEYMSNYSQSVADEEKEVVDQVADECNEEIKNHISFVQHTGKYVKSFRIKTTYEDRFNKRKTWYASNGQYRLTHLLENAHALRNGDRSRSFPHIKYGEELAIRRMEELSKEAIERANGH